MVFDAIAIPPRTGQPPDHLLVALHGWGANRHDLAGLAPYLDLPTYQFIFPNAPFDHPQVPGGRAWYALEYSNIPAFDLRQLTGLEEARQQLRDWLPTLEAQTGIPLGKTVLLGFSQGGAMALDVGLGFPLAGICSISGYPHGPLTVTADPVPPVLVVHGQVDPVVPLVAARQVQQELTAAQVSLTYRELPAMGHDIPPQALALVQQFITALG
ncbi:dienelactone hydrolase family protein [Spirulina major CS-329]|uniref:alpha/beta hydrolase n=1 Tax=Spirulina TaxID=1154 RepID=UPI002330D140|nr:MULTISPECIES: dienelactone hydrolase family protein [Spirulina]MDB9493954.1 dienelactone hydrolase family protein [Spirulina subsalsa CS-330]MDB9503713.1 dienelactone hydrolase family protein [Spirulina major CS-329]